MYATTQFFTTKYRMFSVSLTCLGFSQVQDYLGSLVLVPHLASFLGHYLLLEWLGWDLVCLLVPSLAYWNSVLSPFLSWGWVLTSNLCVICCSPTTSCCFINGIRCSVIKRYKPGYIPSPRRIVSHQVSYVNKFFVMASNTRGERLKWNLDKD